MDDLSIKQALLGPITRQRVKELMISTGDDDLMLHIDFGENTSGKIATTFAISVQSASARLEKLYRKGYLTRKSVQQDSGGYEWEYSNLFAAAKQKGGDS